ncbi:hypothetical protein K8R66_00580 [bacterium]|nr:hypothetical protein [bacterium]
MSRACSVQNVGCLGYKGNSSYNVENILFDNFESGGINDNWSITSNGSSANFIYSNESTYYNGHSMKAWVNDDTSNLIELRYDLNDAGLHIEANTQYILNFWAKPYSRSGDEGSEDDDDGELTKTIFDNLIKKAQALDVWGDTDNGNVLLPNLTFGITEIIPGEEWVLYEAIVEIGEFVESEQNLKIRMSFDNSVEERDGFYIDNISLKKVSTNFYKIKDSWNTPLICLDANSDNILDYEYLGCKEYKDRYKDYHYIYNFSNICSEENVGCAPFIDTQNSQMPFNQVFNAYCKNTSDGCNLGSYYYVNNGSVHSDNDVESTVLVAEDKLVYLVDDQDYYCGANNKACQELGVYNSDGEIDTVYKINDPDDYKINDYYSSTQGEILCFSEYQDCTAFAKPDKSLIYKIHPRDKVCEYREADLENEIKAGFYKVSNLEESCEGFIYDEAYSNFVDYINKVDDDWKPYGDYNSKYAALCPDEQSSCSGFIEPMDNVNMKDDAALNLGDLIDFSEADAWSSYAWDKDIANGGFNDEQIDDNISSNGKTIQIDISNTGSGVLADVFGYNHENDFFYDFYSKAGDMYKLSAWVQFVPEESGDEYIDHHRFISTFLSCKGNKIFECSYPGDLDCSDYGYDYGDLIFDIDLCEVDISDCSDIPPVDGQCNDTYNGQEFYGVSTDYISPSSGDLCTFGTISDVDYTAPNWTWVCTSIDGGGSADCSATRIWCGDGTKNSDEVCDGTDFGGEDCSSIFGLDDGFTGNLICDNNCTTINNSGCVIDVDSWISAPGPDVACPGRPCIVRFDKVHFTCNSDSSNSSERYVWVDNNNDYGSYNAYDYTSDHGAWNVPFNYPVSNTDFQWHEGYMSHDSNTCIIDDWCSGVQDGHNTNKCRWNTSPFNWRTDGCFVHSGRNPDSCPDEEL